MAEELPPPPPPPVGPRGWEVEPEQMEAAATQPRTPGNLLPWIAGGCGVGLLTVGLLVVGLLLALPRAREELALLLAPSRAESPPPPESPRINQSALPPGPVRINGDFSSPSDVWEQAGARIADGGYELRVDTANFDSYGLYLGSNGMPIGNFDLTVDATQLAGPRDAEFGIRFRQPGPENYLMFAISPSGYYRLVRVDDGNYSSLVPWTFSPRIKTGEGTVNRLRIIADGTRIRGYVNGSELIDVQDEVGLTGQLTLGATTFGEGGLRVRFDNLEGQAEGQVLDEDFANAETAAWSVGGSQIIDGQYEMFAGIGIQLLQQPQPPRSSLVRDFELEVDATLVDGSGDGVGYGVLFGYSENFTYYGLLLLPTGEMLLYRTGPQGSSALVPPLQVDAVRPGLNQTNTIRVTLRDERLSIAINGETVIDNEQLGPVEGEVGLLISSGETSRAVARFDNFRLSEGGRRA